MGRTNLAEKTTEEQANLFHSNRGLGRRMLRIFLAKWPRGGPEYRDEIESASLIGLLEAARRWEPEGRCTFATYACKLIWYEMTRRRWENECGKHDLTREQQAKEYRRRYRERKLAELALLYDTGPSTPQIEVVEECNRVLSLIRPKYRELLVRHWLEGVPYTEIAKERGVSPQAISLMARTAIREIREIVGSQPELRERFMAG